MILLLIYKSIEICLHCNILVFRLFICFRVKCGRKLFFDAKMVTKLRLELGYKNRFIVINNGVRKAMISYHYFDNYFCKFWKINSDFNRFVVDYFGPAVDNNENQVITIAFLTNEKQLSYYKIH